MSDVHVTVDTELKPGRVYAVRIPDGRTVLELQLPLREIAEVTGARLVVFHDGATVSEIHGEAVKGYIHDIDRLRRLLREALDAEDAAYNGGSWPRDRLAEMRREAHR